MRTYFGIDISKEHLDFGTEASPKCTRVNNDKEGIKHLVRDILKTTEPFVVLEATGGYQRESVRTLVDAGIDVAVVNPRRTRAFAESLGVLAKTDRIDTRVLARFGEAVRPPVVVMTDEATQEVDALVRRRRDMVDVRSAEKNRLKQAPSRVQPSIERHIKYLDEEVKQLDRQIEDAISANAQFKHKARMLRAVKGVGPVTASTLLALLPELGLINRQQVASLVGVAPFNKDSGSSEKPRHVRGGRQAVRSVLYMAAQTAVRFNPRLRAFYERMLAKGKERRVAMTAAARKLLVWLNAMIQTNCPWDVSHQLQA